MGERSRAEMRRADGWIDDVAVTGRTNSVVGLEANAKRDEAGRDMLWVCSADK